MNLETRSNVRNVAYSAADQAAIQVVCPRYPDRLGYVVRNEGFSFRKSNLAWVCVLPMMGWADGDKVRLRGIRAVHPIADVLSTAL